MTATIIITYSEDTKFSQTLIDFLTENETLKTMSSSTGSCSVKVLIFRIKLKN